MNPEKCSRALSHLRDGGRTQLRVKANVTHFQDCHTDPRLWVLHCPWCLKHCLTSDCLGWVKNTDLHFKGEIFLISKITEANRTFLRSRSFLMRKSAKGIGQCHFSYFRANKIPSLVSTKLQAALGSLKNCFL